MASKSKYLRNALHHPLVRELVSDLVAAAIAAVFAKLRESRAGLAGEQGPKRKARGALRVVEKSIPPGGAKRRKPQ